MTAQSANRRRYAHGPISGLGEGDYSELAPDVCERTVFGALMTWSATPAPVQSAADAGVDRTPLYDINGITVSQSR